MENLLCTLNLTVLYNDEAKLAILTNWQARLAMLGMIRHAASPGDLQSSHHEAALPNLVSKPECVLDSLGAGCVVLPFHDTLDQLIRQAFRALQRQSGMQCCKRARGSSEKLTVCSICTYQCSQYLGYQCFPKQHAAR